MLLKDWRQEKGWTLARFAEELHIPGSSPAETVRRWETGESRPDADMVAKICVTTDGAITANDMHETRLSWLRAKSARLNSSAHDEERVFQ